MSICSMTDLLILYLIFVVSLQFLVVLVLIFVLGKEVISLCQSIVNRLILKKTKSFFLNLPTDNIH